MENGLAIIPGGLLLIMLAAGTIFASEIACPNPPTKPPRLFLQTDHLKIPAPPESTGNPAGQKGYQRNETLIRGVPAATTTQTSNSSVELAGEKDLAALRIKTEGAITPYVGAGVATGPDAEETPGLSTFEAEREAERQELLVGAGLACDLSQSTRLNLGYRYSTGNLPELPGVGLVAPEPENDDHNISFGLKLDF
jgi:opacity protein-like surface antigen